ncbi:hypothetical protein B4U80_14067 [Leptotrombidium deliense]|uniref:Uncharacterized protein n=1 Tax=Leptotrombidium deliense TaxID=299467 RepID=A0A443S3N5_9ACAR|nr:hypothetical protein B4U80_14067 [Leptotrombidium deliense]
MFTYVSNDYIECTMLFDDNFVDTKRSKQSHCRVVEINKTYLLIAVIVLVVFLIAFICTGLIFIHFKLIQAEESVTENVVTKIEISTASSTTIKDKSSALEMLLASSYFNEQVYSMFSKIYNEDFGHFLFILFGSRNYFIAKPAIQNFTIPYRDHKNFAYFIRSDSNNKMEIWTNQFKTEIGDGLFLIEGFSVTLLEGDDQRLLHRITSKHSKIVLYFCSDGSVVFSDLVIYYKEITIARKDKTVLGILKTLALE